MPLLNITTNHPLNPTSSNDLLKQISGEVARILGKPERYVMVALNHNPQMLFAGDDSPLAYLELKSIGLPADRTADFSKALCELITQHLQIPSDRIYIEFSDAQRHMWGWDAGTF